MDRMLTHRQGPSTAVIDETCKRFDTIFLLFRVEKCADQVEECCGWRFQGMNMGGPVFDYIVEKRMTDQKIL
jgi:hypothetical protein